MSDELSGHMLGKYKVEEVIGKGGMGTVYLGRHSMLDSRVAIKVLGHEITSKPSLVKRFFLEAKAVAKLSDPGLPQLYDYGHAEDGRAYMVMEYLEGETLRARLKRCGPLDEVAFLRLVAQIARTLAKVHEHGVVHRDLKPDNIFIVKDSNGTGGDKTKLLDFGVAKLTKLNPGEAALTQATELLGTPYYMAPEQWQGAHMVDTRADIYSLGCIMYCCLCGQVPFVGDTIGKICAGHIVEEPKPLTELRAAISQPVNDLVLHCLAKEPNERPTSMTQLAEQIDACLSELEGAHSEAQPEASDETSAAEQQPAPPRPGSKTSRAKRKPTPSRRRGKGTKAAQKSAPARQSRETSSAKPRPVVERRASALSGEQGSSAASGERQRASASAVEEQATVVFQSGEEPSAEQRPSSPRFEGFESTMSLSEFERVQSSPSHAGGVLPAESSQAAPLSTEQEEPAQRKAAPLLRRESALAGKETVRLDAFQEALASHQGDRASYDSFVEPPTEELEMPLAVENGRPSYDSFPEPPTEELPMPSSWGGASGYGRASDDGGADSSGDVSGSGGPPSYDERTPLAISGSVRQPQSSRSARKRLVALAAAVALMLCAWAIWFVADDPEGSPQIKDGKVADVSQRKPAEEDPHTPADPEPNKPESTPGPGSADLPEGVPPASSADPIESAEPVESAKPESSKQEAIKQSLVYRRDTGIATEPELNRLMTICIEEKNQRCVNTTGRKIKQLRDKPKIGDIYE